MSTQIDYKIVVELIYPNGDEEYVIWEPLLYAEMIERQVDFNKLFFSSPELIRTPPLEVYIWLYGNPTIRDISQTMGDKKVIRQLLVGKKICQIAYY